MTPASPTAARLARLAPVPAALASGLLVVTAPAGWPRVAAAVAVGALVAIGTPHWLSVAARTRPPTAAELTAARPALDGTVDVTLRVATDTGFVGNAVVAGVLPGQRYVFVAADLFDLLDADATAAVVAHEVAHHSRRHVLLRHGMAVVAAGYVVALAEFAPWRLLPTVAVGAVPYLLATAWVIRRTERTADRVAARRTDPDALAGALEALVEAGLVLGGTGRIRRLFTEHPSVQSRVASLRGQDARRADP